MSMKKLDLNSDTVIDIINKQILPIKSNEENLEVYDAGNALYYIIKYKHDKVTSFNNIVVYKIIYNKEENVFMVINIYKVDPDHNINITSLNCIYVVDETGLTHAII